jgi:alkylhydroperoxidase/carboxymuconolactone decarboxylase family protein YurZ
MFRPRTQLLVALLTLLVTLGGTAQTSPAAPAQAGGGAMAGSPYLGQILRDDLYGDVWERPGLAPRDRSLITIAVTQSLYATEEIRAHITRGLNNGLTQAEISELIAHVLVYSGFPTGVNAARVATEVFQQRGLPAVPPSTPRNREPVGPPAYPNSFPATPYLAALLNEWVYGEVWERPDLSKRDRSLATIAVAQAMGAASELRSHIARGLDNGVTQEEVGEVITHVAFYTGIPGAVNAARVAAAVFGSRNLPMPQSDIPAAPYLDTIIDGLLASTWERSPLSARERTLITVAVMQTLYSTEELRNQMVRAIDSGITPQEISELIAHVTLYAGFPMGVNSSRTAGAVFQERGSPMPR